MSITFSRFGHHGRLGNQLFQYAALIGFSTQFKRQLALPKWNYTQYFKTQFPTGGIDGAIQLKEPHFHYTPEWWAQQLEEHSTVDILGWLQSENYWSHCVDSVKSALSFKESFIQEVLRKTGLDNLHNAIAISIRRGDYVGNPNYYQLPITYYLHALYEHFPNWQQRPVLIFSDDLPYCKIHFAAANNVIYADDLSDIEQLCLMSRCKDFIISNSTFAWWGAYLGEKENSTIVRPAHHFAGKLLQTSDAKDYYPQRWINFNHEGRKFDLTDVTFTVPVSFDHPHRRQNLDLNICMLQRDFETNIIIGEQGPTPVFQYFAQWCRYRYFPMQEFHRTRMLNIMARMATTSVVVNWDADVFVPPLSILISVHALQQGIHFVYPYDGRFARVMRSWHKPLEQSLDLGIFRDSRFPGTDLQKDAISVGGAVFCNKKAFIKAGMENEKMISYAPEDRERYLRFTRLGFRVVRIPGPIYHLDHYRGPNSSSANRFFQANTALYKSYQNMPTETLQAEINTWPWLQQEEQTTTAQGIDIVIPLGRGSVWKNNELRYALRSIEQHVTNIRNLYIVGECPEFIDTSKAIHLPVKDMHQTHPARNIYLKLLLACYEPELSSTFLYFNDDYVITQSVDALSIPCYHKEFDLSESAAKVQPGNTFRTALENTAAVLQQAGKPIKNFDIHVPMPIKKDVFASLLSQYNWDVPFGYTAKSLYCNSAGIDGELWYDCKFKNNATPERLEEVAKERWVFSYGDEALYDGLKDWLQNQFPNASRWEKA